MVPIGNPTEYYTFAPVCLCMNTHNSICLPLCVPLDHPLCLPLGHTLCSLCNKTHTKPTAVLSCVAKPIRKSLMNLTNFNEIWGSQFETAKIEKIIKDFTPVSNLAVLLISKIFIQVGPLTPQRWRLWFACTAKTVVPEIRIFCPDMIAHISCLGIAILKKWLSCFWQCLFCAMKHMPKHTRF